MTVVTAEMAPHGLRCINCDAPMPIGSEYRERLVTLGKLGGEDCATVEIICACCDERETAPSQDGER